MVAINMGVMLEGMAMALAVELNGGRKRLRSLQSFGGISSGRRTFPLDELRNSRDAQCRAQGWNVGRRPLNGRHHYQAWKDNGIARQADGWAGGKMLLLLYHAALLQRQAVQT